MQLLRDAAVAVKFMLVRDMQNVLGDYDISCGLVMGSPFVMHVDITPKNKQCLAVIPSTLLH